MDLSPRRLQVPLSPAPRAPARELDRGLRRQPSDVPQIEQPSRSRNQFSSAKCEVNPAHINSALANFKYQRLGAARLSLRHGLVHEDVCVTAGNEVNAVNLRRNERIAP